MYPRLANILTSHSFFLFGARATGKSYLLERKLEGLHTIWIDLLDDELFLSLTKRPRLLEERLIGYFEVNKTIPDWIVLDEIQRVPKLLNEVHRLLESKQWRGKLKFALTGSSARKLKRLGANMLGGRASVLSLFPLTFLELQQDFKVDAVLNWGSLPAVCTATNDQTRSAILRSYVSTYLAKEIREEQVVRQLDPFVRFLEVAAQASGTIVNNAAIGRDCQVDPKAVARYFQILEDTLLGYMLPAYSRSIRKQQSQAAKFYLFDLGVQRALRGTLSVPIVPENYEYGRCFEQLIILEMHRLNSYLETDLKFSYLRTKDGAEVDLIIETPKGELWLVEIKSSKSITEHSAKKLERFLPSFPKAKAVILSQEPQGRRVGKVRVLPWQQGIKEILGLSASS